MREIWQNAKDFAIIRLKIQNYLKGYILGPPSKFIFYQLLSKLNQQINVFSDQREKKYFKT